MWTNGATKFGSKFRGFLLKLLSAVGSLGSCPGCWIAHKTIPVYRGQIKLSQIGRGGEVTRASAQRPDRYCPNWALTALRQSQTIWTPPAVAYSLKSMAAGTCVSVELNSSSKTTANISIKHHQMRAAVEPDVLIVVSPSVWITQ